MVRVLTLELHYTALGKARTAELLAHLESYFDYLDSHDRMLFREQWPPPGILRMAKKGAGQRKFFLAWRGVELYRQLSHVSRRISRYFRGA